MRSFRLLCGHYLLGLGLLGMLPAAAQGASPTVPRPQPLQYMTLTTVESDDPLLAKILLTSSSRATRESYFEAYDGASEASNSFAYGRNQERLTKQLDELAADGWEVLEVHPALYLPASQTYSTRYLLRLRRP